MLPPKKASKTIKEIKKIFPESEAAVVSLLCIFCILVAVVQSDCLRGQNMGLKNSRAECLLAGRLSSATELT